jgi:hypothetical protein
LVSWPFAPSEAAETASPSCRSGSGTWSSSLRLPPSVPSTYALRNPWKVMTRPDAPKTTSRPSAAAPPMRTETDWPTASFICEATVRIQISS